MLPIVWCAIPSLSLPHSHPPASSPTTITWHRPTTNHGRHPPLLTCRHPNHPSAAKHSSHQPPSPRSTPTFSSSNVFLAPHTSTLQSRTSTLQSRTKRPSSLPMSRPFSPRPSPCLAEMPFCPTRKNNYGNQGQWWDLFAPTR